jgi:hypothetical protein
MGSQRGAANKSSTACRKRADHIREAWGRQHLFGCRAGNSFRGSLGGASEGDDCDGRWAADRGSGQLPRLGDPVMPGLVPGIHAATLHITRKIRTVRETTAAASNLQRLHAPPAWMAGTSPAMTENDVLSAWLGSYGSGARRVPDRFRAGCGSENVTSLQKICERTALGDAAK